MISVFDAPTKKLPVGSGSAGGLTVPEIVAAQPVKTRTIATETDKKRVFMGLSHEWVLGTWVMVTGIFTGGRATIRVPGLPGPRRKARPTASGQFPHRSRRAPDSG